MVWQPVYPTALPPLFHQRLKISVKVAKKHQAEVQFASCLKNPFFGHPTDWCLVFVSQFLLEVNIVPICLNRLTQILKV